MTQASPEEQMRLLQLQHLDAQRAAIDAEIRALEQDSQVRECDRQRRQAAQLHASLNAERDEKSAALAAAEAELNAVTERITRDERWLESGGLSKELLALQAEIDHLKQRRATAEEQVLACMETLEGVENQCKDGDLRLKDAQEAYMRKFSQVQEDKKTAQDRREELHRERTQLAGTFSPEVLEVYEHTRERRGVGAARLFHGFSEGSGMRLSPGDLDTITRAPADEIVFCPDSGCILVRSAEWS